jgi:hypothetical protein
MSPCHPVQTVHIRNEPAWDRCRGFTYRSTKKNTKGGHRLYLSHWESTQFLVLTFLTRARYDYTVDQPSVQPEGSSKVVGLGHTADDRMWGSIVDLEEGGYWVTWASLVLEESCYSYYAT